VYGTLVDLSCLALFKCFDERSINNIRRVMEVPFCGYLNNLQAVLPGMQKQGHGIVYNVRSGVGYIGVPG
jgi:short-subunit dehydrogenase